MEYLIIVKSDNTQTFWGQASKGNTYTANFATHVKDMLDNTYVFHMYNNYRLCCVMENTEI